MSISEIESSTTNDLTSSIAENLVISSSIEQEKSQSTNQTLNTSEQIICNSDTEIKKSTIECDNKQNENRDFHLIKWIEFNYEKLPILLQNVNGPCPLLAIFNILLLRKRIIIDSNRDAISTERVITLLAEHMIERDQSKLSEEERVNYEHNVQDALAILDKLKTGLDVNLKFDRIDQFEYTRECIIFDLLNIPLYHGWIVDPQDTELRTIVTTDAPSYNQLVEKMIRQRTSEREELIRESLLIEQFLDENRSQLTHYGILQLNQTMRDNQLGVLFRNNHFSTIWKHQNQLLLLVSDQGYLDHQSIVFETLTDIDNDSLFTDGYGRIWRKPEPVDSSRDRELAIAMHNEECLYHEAQQQQLQGMPNQLSRSPSKQSKKSKNKSHRSSHDDSEKESCNII